MKQQVAKKVVSGLIMGCLTLSFGALALAHGEDQVMHNYHNNNKTPAKFLQEFFI